MRIRLNRTENRLEIDLPGKAGEHTAKGEMETITLGKGEKAGAVRLEIDGDGYVRRIFIFGVAEALADLVARSDPPPRAPSAPPKARFKL